MAAPTLAPSDFRTPEVLRARERMARTMRDAEVGQAYLCYETFLRGSNPYLFSSGGDGDAAVRHQYKMGYTGAQATEVAQGYTSQPQVSMRKFVNRMMSEGMPEGSEWAVLDAGDDYDEKTAPSPDQARERAEDAEAVRTMLKPMQRRVFQELHRSNAQEEVPGAVMDASIWRVGVLLVRRLPEDEMGPAKVAFEHVPQNECSFDWFPGGICTGVYRQHYFTQEEAQYYWPEGDGWQFDDATPQSGDSDLPRATFIEAVYRVPGKRWWAWQVMQVSTSSGSERATDIMCLERALPRNPFIVFGVAGPPGAPLTQSLAESALATCRTLNTMTRINLDAAEMRATPAFTVEQGGLLRGSHTKRIFPAQLIPVKSNLQSQPSMRPLEVSGDVNLGWMTEDRLTDQAKALLYDQGVPPPQPQPITARQILELVQELKNNIGPLFSRILRRLGVPILQHILDVLYEEGEVRGMNRAGGMVSAVELDGKEVRVTFTNPLAQAQRLNDVEDIAAWLELVKSLVPPESAAASISYEKVAELTGRPMRVPEQLYRPERQAAQLAEQAAQTQVMGGAQAPSPDATRQPAGQASMFGAPASVH